MKTVAILTGGTSSERDVALQSAKTVADALAKFYNVKVFDFPNEIDGFLKGREKIDVAVPVFHGKGGEDGMIQGFLKILGVPFIFSDVEAHAIGLDKAVTKALVARTNVQTSFAIVLRRDEPYKFIPPFFLKTILL